MFTFKRKTNGRRRNREELPPRSCDWPGCDSREGHYRAPVSPDALRTYRWFCLEHVREYNRAWNYYAGKTEEEIEADVRKDTVWWRPSWPLGGMGRGPHGLGEEGISDGFGPMGGGAGGNGGNGTRRGPQTPEIKAMAVLDLHPPLTVSAVKTRYKELVKRHHPDANDGDKASEEKFKQIADAYQTIMDSLTA